jgi:hypothetical protein
VSGDTGRYLIRQEGVATMTYHQLTQEERYRISAHRMAGATQGEIARLLRRSPSTISRELKRNATPETLQSCLTLELTRRTGRWFIATTHHGRLERIVIPHDPRLALENAKRPRPPLFAEGDTPRLCLHLREHLQTRACFGRPQMSSRGH